MIGDRDRKLLARLQRDAEVSVAAVADRVSLVVPAAISMEMPRRATAPPAVCA